jgi:hypothetical protein
LKPFSQNSATLLSLSGFGHAQLWQSKPLTWFNFNADLIVFRSPASLIPYSATCSIAFIPAAILVRLPCLVPFSVTGGSASGFDACEAGSVGCEGMEGRIGHPSDSQEK